MFLGNFNVNLILFFFLFILIFILRGGGGGVSRVLLLHTFYSDILRAVLFWYFICL